MLTHPNIQITPYRFFFSYARFVPNVLSVPMDLLTKFIFLSTKFRQRERQRFRQREREMSHRHVYMYGLGIKERNE